MRSTPRSSNRSPTTRPRTRLAGCIFIIAVAFAVAVVTLLPSASHRSRPPSALGSENKAEGFRFLLVTTGIFAPSNSFIRYLQQFLLEVHPTHAVISVSR